MLSRDAPLYRGWATIRGDWDRFYREFPGLYDRFALSTVLVAKEMHKLVDFTGTRVLVLASGTGKDAFEIAQHAGHVIGIEPWIEMRGFAIAKQQRLGVRNIDFVDGIAEDLSRFADGEFDRCISVQGAPFPWSNKAFVGGCLRVVRPSGYVAFGGTRGSSSAHMRGSTDPSPPPRDNELLTHFGFVRYDVPATLDFGSVEEALATWGFIYGDDAIDYLIDEPAPSLHVRLVIHYREV